LRFFYTFAKKFKDMNNRAKEKLIEVRKERGLTQKDIADRLHLEVSGYSRRESGETKIRIEQWVELAKMLNVSLERIYEEDENQSFTFNDSTIGDFCASNINNVSITVLESVLETYQKYIRKLEEEIAELKLLIKK
jgi:transcriptional regulator with XRE-family HTH domain